MLPSLTRGALAIALAGALAVACADDDGAPGPTPVLPDGGARLDGGPRDGAAGAGARDGAAGGAAGHDAATNGG